ncbi:MAG: hypothetical protein Q9M31_04315 [Mariprofundus sp.]|nr:hypothetical protein [Mariprofundus sp.]
MKKINTIVLLLFYGLLTFSPSVFAADGSVWDKAKKGLVTSSEWSAEKSNDSFRPTNGGAKASSSEKVWLSTNKKSDKGWMATKEETGEAEQWSKKNSKHRWMKNHASGNNASGGSNKSAGEMWKAAKKSLSELTH